MKPINPTIANASRQNRGPSFPLTDFNFHSITLEGAAGRCARQSSPAFRNISRSYFETEAQHDFLAEASVFAVIMVTVAVPLLSGAHAVLNLVRALGGV